MMIPTKLITFILQAVLVIAAVIVFSFVDPFNIFNSKKLNMKDTPTIVSSIQSIGKLVTAEYYGEVIKSTGDALELTIDSAKNEDRARLKLVLANVNEALSELKDSLGDKLNNKRKVFRQFKRNYSAIMKDPDYKVLLTLVKEGYNLGEKDFLQYFYKEDDPDLNTYTLARNTTKNFDDVIKVYLEKKYKYSNKEDRRIANNSLVLLGRGWVKVGFDFSHFDDDHFDYFPDRNLIRLKRHQPEIISATINPWFIPQRKIKGFEYLYVGKKISRNPDKEDAVQIIQNLKQDCLDNLINDAKDAGIMQTAIEQAEASLGGLFSLLLGKDITVRIYADPMQAFLADVLSDKRITAREIKSADSVVNRYYNEMPAQTFQFLKDLRQSQKKSKTSDVFPWPGAEDNWEITSFFNTVADDDFCTSTELDSINGYVDNKRLFPKDYLYYALSHGKEDTLLTRVSFDTLKVSRLYPGFKELVKQSRKRNLDSLRSNVLKLRRHLGVSEIQACDDTISKYLNRGKIRKAFAYAKAAEEFMDETTPWEEIRYSWAVLSLYRKIKDPATPLANITILPASAPSRPRPNEYLYCLFYDGSYAKDSVSARKLVEAFIKPAATAIAGQESLKNKVQKIHAANLKTLGDSASSVLKQRMKTVTVQ